jgi:hypothetical protein
MWTAEVTSKTVTDGRLDVRIQLVNGERTVAFTATTHYSRPATWLADEIKLKIQEIESIEALADSITFGAVDLELRKEDDPAMTARSAWLTDFYRLKKLEGAIAEKLLTADDPEYVALAQQVKADFLPEYAEYMKG